MKHLGQPDSWRQSGPVAAGAQGAGEERRDANQGVYSFSLARWIHSKEMLFNCVSILNNAVLYTYKFIKRVHQVKCYHIWIKKFKRWQSWSHRSIEKASVGRENVPLSAGRMASDGRGRRWAGLYTRLVLTTCLKGRWHLHLNSYIWMGQQNMKS